LKALRCERGEISEGAANVHGVHALIPRSRIAQ
jgi:hypothetical protein